MPDRARRRSRNRLERLLSGVTNSLEQVLKRPVVVEVTEDADTIRFEWKEYSLRFIAAFSLITAGLVSVGVLKTNPRARKKFSKMYRKFLAAIRNA